MKGVVRLFRTGRIFILDIFIDIFLRKNLDNRLNLTYYSCAASNAEPLPRDAGSRKMEVKGTLIATIPHFVKSNFGEQGLEKWLDTLSTDARLVFEFKVKESQWYDLKTFMLEPVSFVAQLFYNWNLEKAGWEMGRFALDHGFKGIYRMFLKVGKPEFFVGKGPVFASGFYRPCKMEVPFNERGKATVRIVEFPDIDKTIEYRIGGWMQRGLEMNGCTDVKVEVVRSLMKGDPYTEYQLTYKP